MIKLEEDEVRTLFTALAVARRFYQDRGMEEEAQKHQEVFDLLFHSSSIKVEYGPGLTEIGRISLEETLQKRKQRMDRDNKVVEFPGIIQQ